MSLSKPVSGTWIDMTAKKVKVLVTNKKARHDYLVGKNITDIQTIELHAPRISIPTSNGLSMSTILDSVGILPILSLSVADLAYFVTKIGATHGGMSHYTKAELVLRIQEFYLVSSNSVEGLGSGRIVSIFCLGFVTMLYMCSSLFGSFSV